MKAKFENKRERYKRLRIVSMSAEEYAEIQAGQPLRPAKHVVEALIQFEDWPSEETYIVLKEMYEAIPVDQRRFCLGDQDRKDFPVRHALRRWETKDE